MSISNLAPRIVYFGRPCELSSVPLTALCAAGYDIVATIMPARSPLQRRPIQMRPAPRLLLGSPPDALHAVCCANCIPLWEVADLSAPEVLESLAPLAPDLLVVSCFPWRIPSSLLTMARYGGLNVHPSLLPRHRGPEPHFWVFRVGERRSGVTVHQLAARLDAGAIVAQQAIDLPPGAQGDSLERESTEVAARLLPAAIERTLSGAHPMPQDEAHASYETWPADHDLVIPRHWRVERAWSFARGILPLGYQPTIEVNGELLTIQEAVAFSEQATLRALDAPLHDRLRGDLLDAAFVDGEVRFRVVRSNSAPGGGDPSTSSG